MKQRAQGAVEYLFMVATALIIIAILIAKFFNPRSGTVKKVGEMQAETEEKINDTLNDQLSQ
ncbi:MAG: hypothetical protein PWQ79_1539 [Thermococcaceae archaeon]|nr:hypothetical protein [Thermococcaceae archaeon]